MVETMKPKDRRLERVGIGRRPAGCLGLEAPGGRFHGWTTSIYKGQGSSTYLDPSIKIY